MLAIAGEKGQYPLRVNANGGLYLLKDGRDIPDVFMMSVDFPGEFTVFLESVLTNNSNVPTRIYGQYGTIELDGSPVLTGNGDFIKEFKALNNGYTNVTIPVEKQDDPYRALQGNFMEVIRKGGTLYCGVDLGTSTMVAIKMGVESYRQKKTMTWDAKNERVIS